MSKVGVHRRKSSLGSLARRMRNTEHMTQQELADVVGVSAEQVDSFERSLPVALDIKRRLLKELWARKHGR